MPIRHIAAWILLLAPVAMMAQQPFEVVVAGASDGCMLAIPGYPILEWVTPDRQYHVSDIVAVASAPGQPVFGVLFGPNGTIVRVQPDNSRTPFFPGAPGFGSGDIAVAPTGRVFTSIAAGLAVFSPAGVHENTYAMPGRDESRRWIATAPDDSCTVYYAKPGGVIGRMNGCTGQMLSDFTTVTFGFNDFHPLPNGQMIVAKSLGSIVLYDAAGAEVREIANLQSYGINPLDYQSVRIATTPDRQVLWIAAGDGCAPGILLRILISDGRELLRRDMDVAIPVSIVVGNAVSADIPTVSETMLLFIAMALAAAGVFVLRQ